MKENNSSTKLTIIFLFVILLVVIAITVIAGNNQTQSNQNQAAPADGAGSVWLGVQVIVIDKIVAKDFNIPYKRGLIVETVINGSPADDAGIIEGDIIRRINNKDIINTEQLRQIISKKLPGQRVRIVYIRNEVTMITYVTLQLPTITNPNIKLVHGTYPTSAPPTNKPYPYFYFGDEYEPPDPPEPPEK